jgi:hypothetical protein
MSDDLDWLEISPPTLPAIVNDEAKYQGMVAALQRCSPKQRLYLNELQTACFDEDAARKTLADKGVRISRHRIRSWENEPSFTQALRDSIEYSLAAAAVSQVGVVAQLQRAVRVNGALVKCQTEHGEPYEKFVDAAALNTALDRLAKRLGMLKTDEAPAQRQLPAFVVGIQVQTNPGQSETTVKVVSNGD